MTIMGEQDVLAVLQDAANDVLGSKAPLLAPDTVLGGGADIDSLDLIEIVLLVEGQLDIEIEEAELKEIKTVEDVVALVARKIGSAGVS